jgi:hypothetical protein
MTTKMKALTQDSLAKMGCGNPDCTDDHGTLFFSSGCHPDAGAWAAYEKATGLLTLVCAACDQRFAVMRIASSH